MSAHARLSPSNHRWVHCPGSIREEANYPDISSAPAIDGTGSHLLLEMCLERNHRADYFLDKIIGEDHEDKPKGWKVGQDRIDRVNMCLDYIERRKKELYDRHESISKNQIFISDLLLHGYDDSGKVIDIKSATPIEVIVSTESKSNPGEMYHRTDWWGTVDITLIVKLYGITSFIEIIDYKDGRGYVTEKNNSQLISYMAGKLYELTKFKGLFDVCMTIVQPKTKVPVRYQEIHSEVLEELAEGLAEAANKTDDPNAPLIPDDKKGKGYCQWCKHKSNCKALFDKKREEPNMIDLNRFNLPNPNNVEGISPVIISKLLNAKKTIEEMFDELEKEAEKRLNAGEDIPGYAMRPGSNQKSWSISEEELVLKLKACKLKKDDIYISKLISPAQVLAHESLTKVQKERIEENYIKLTPDKMKLKPLSKKDKEESILDMFSDIDLQCKTSSDKVSFL